MNIERSCIEAGAGPVPSIMISGADPRGCALIIHGYGGCKEEQLGLAWRVAEFGINACVPDLPGHGEHTRPYGEHLLEEIQAAVQYCRGFGRVVAIGHSLGGRLSLASTADYAIGISPALGTEYGEQTREIIRSMRGYRVRETASGVNFEILRTLPTWAGSDDRPAALLYGTRDVPEIAASCAALRSRGELVMEVKNALHNDIFLLEETFGIVTTLLGKWFE
jgi:alpha-beta hydrolase superfamily lysophospholipase